MRRALAALALVPGVALAHGGGVQAPVPGWTLSPWLLVPLAVTAAVFAAGWWRLRARSGAGRAGLDRRAALFGAGWLVLAGALASPLHELGERSFAAHMAEHELLMLVAAPLLVLGGPLAIMLWAFPPGGRQALGRMATGLARPWQALTGALFATLLQAAVLWLWHAPALFDRALGSEAWHDVQHASFLVGGLVFWTAMLSPRTQPAVAVVCLFATSVISGALGALMAFAASPWYARYAELGMAPLGLTPVEDQQLAGLLMWVPGGMVHAGAGLVLAHRMLRNAGSRAHAG